MTHLALDLSALPEPNPDAVAALEMRVGKTQLTQLARLGANAEAGALRVPVEPLAWWFGENWWRLRWESRPSNPSDGWRMAHNMSAIGEGHVWPRVTIWGDRDRVMLVARADPPGVAGPVRLLSNAVLFTSAADFEKSVDRLFVQALSIVHGARRAELSELIDTIGEERGNARTAHWRRLEAVSGYGPSEAPEVLVHQLLALEKDYRPADVEEAAIAEQGPQAAMSLTEAIKDTKRRGAIVDFSAAVRVTRGIVTVARRLTPWVVAEKAAEKLRRSIGNPLTPLTDGDWSDVAGITKYALRSQPDAPPRPYALRLAADDAKSRFLLTARWSHDRRFQVARALGDAVWTSGSSLGPISRVGSARQKFQRAFAAALVCPTDGLLDYLGTSQPDDADIAEAARHFHVNERTVRTVLVNKHLMERHHLDQPLTDPVDVSSIDEIADAA